MAKISRRSSSTRIRHRCGSRTNSLSVSIALLIFLAPSIYAADFFIDTTAHFDAGTKSESDGNREVITESDVVSGEANTPATGTMELENLFSDKFDIPDSDGLTAKSQGGSIQTPINPVATDIDTTVNDAIYLECGDDASFGYNIMGSKEKLTGDFEVIIKLDIDVFTPDTTIAGLFAYGNDTITRFGIYRQATSFKSIWEFGGSSLVTTLSISDNHLSLRLRRIGTTIYMDYDLAQDESWTNMMTKTSAFLDDVEIALRYSANTAGKRYGSYKSYKVANGAYASGAYRTSGNWTSAEQIMPAGERMAQTTIYHSGLDAANCIDKVEWLVGGQVKAAYETDITGGASTTIKPDMVTSGSFAAVNADFRIKIYLAGDGSATLVVTKVEGENMAYGTIITSF